MLDTDDELLTEINRLFNRRHGQISVNFQQNRENGFSIFIVRLFCPSIFSIIKNISGSDYVLHMGVQLNTFAAIVS